MIDNLFLKHPRSVNETYGEHFGVAMSFSIALFAGALAAAVHALLPSLFETTASRIVTRLHGRMVTNRIRHAANNPVATDIPSNQAG